MRYLITLVVGLLLAAPAWADARKGLVEHMPTLNLPDCTSGNYTGMRAWDTTLDLEVTCDGTSWVPTVSGSGTVTDVLGCDGSVTPDCNDIDANATSKLDLGAVDAYNSGTNDVYFRPPHDSQVSCVSLLDTDLAADDGRLCWADTTKRLMISVDNAQPADQGWLYASGDIYSVFNCKGSDAYEFVPDPRANDGACDDITVNDGGELNFQDGTLTVNNATEGLFLPGNPGNCSDWAANEAEGQVCWDDTTDELWIGTSGVDPVLIGPDAGDIESVFDCDTGACNDIDAKANSVLDFTAGYTVGAQTDGVSLVLPMDTAPNCINAVSGVEGDICVSNTTSDVLVGRSPGYQQIGGDIMDIYDCTGTNCDQMNVSSGEWLSFFNVNVSNDSEGLFLPNHPTDCSDWDPTEGEGQVCWQKDTDELWIGTGTTAVLVGPPATGGITATELSDTLCSQVLWSLTDPTEAQGTDDFLDLRDNSGSAISEDDEDNFLMPATTMIVSGLACTVNTAPGAGDEWKMTVRRGTPGALGDTTVTCTIADAATTCSDTTNSEATALTDAITISIDSSGGASDPDGATVMDCRMCLGN